MLRKISALFLCAYLGLAIAGGEAKLQKLTFGSGGVTRTYYLFIPERAGAGPAPMLLLLHGSGHNGKSLIDPWLPLAKSEGIVLVAPDASDPRAWRIPQEGPDFFHDLVELVRISNDVIDDRRMYVFGHSAGAIHGLDLGLLESEYFAAIAVHAGVVSPEMAPALDQAPRKIPMAIWIGTNDPLFPLNAVRNTRDALNAKGFNTQLTEIKNHTHDYYGSAGDINKQVWAFLKEQKLPAAPRYQEYQFTK
ncbi:MAG TPA: alpha/beta fold hydrolase [Vicinamibacterales bacterium]|nr:alpha/beta fold hydrolase [Vicinamibacterales bacterium]